MYGYRLFLLHHSVDTLYPNYQGSTLVRYPGSKGNTSPLIYQKKILKDVSPGVHEPPKVTKEHATTVTHQVPSQSKFISHYRQFVSI